MSWFLIRALIAMLVVLVAPMPSFAQEPVAEERAEVRTAATATRSVQPDLATVTLTLSATGHTPLAAGAAVAARADSVRSALTRLGIPMDSVVSSRQRNWWRGRVEMVVSQGQYVVTAPNTGRLSQDTAYRAYDALEVRIRDLTRVGAVIDTALAYGIIEISPVSYQATNTLDARDGALREAAQRARKEAEIIAGATGGTLGPTVLLSTQEGTPYSLMYDAVVTMGTTASAGTEVVQPILQIRVTVYGRWVLIE